MLSKVPPPIAVSGAGNAVSSGTVVFSNSNNVSFGANGSTITASASYSQPTVTNSSWTVSDNATSGTVGRLAFTNLNGVTLSLSSGTGGLHTVVGSHDALTSQSNQAFSAGGGSSAFQTLAFRDANGISFSNSGGSVQASYTVPTVPAQLSVGDSTGGNTSGDTGLVTGRVVFAGGNNITLSGSTNGGSMTLTISGGAGGAFSAGVSTGGNTSGNTGVTGTRLILAGGNNITVSQGTDANGATVTISGANLGGAQTGISSVAASGGTQTVGMVSFANSNGITFGMSTGANTGTLTASYTVPTQTNQTVGVYGSSQTTGSASSSTYDARSLTFIGAGNISIGNASTSAGGTTTGIILSVTQTVQTQASGGIAGSGFTSAGANVGVSGTNNSAGLSLSVTVAAQSNQTVGLYGSSQTTGSASSGTMDARSVSVIGAGIVSVGLHSTSAGGTTTGLLISATQSNQAFSASGGSSAFQTLSFNNANGFTFSNVGGAVQGSYTVPTVTNSSLTMQAGASTLSSVSRVAFADSNGVSFGASTSNNGSITITATVRTDYLTSQSTQFLAVTLGGNTAGTTTFNASNNATLFLNGGNNVTLSGNGSTITISAANQTAQSAVEGLGVSNTGNTAGNTGLSTGVDWVIAASGAITASQSTAANSNTIWLSVAAQTNQTVGLYATSNTTQGTSGTQDARSLTFAGAGVASVGVTGGSVVVSVPAGGGGGGISAGVSTGGNTAGSTGTISTGNLVFVGTNALTLSQSTGAAGSAATITFSVPATSSLSATGWASISTNGSTISIGASTTQNVYAVGNTFGTSSGTVDVRTLSVSAGTGIQVAASNSGFVVGLEPASFWEFSPGEYKQASSMASGTRSNVNQFCLPYPVSLSFVRFPASVATTSNTFSTAAASMNASFSAGISYNVGIYSQGTGASSRSLMSVTTAQAVWGMLNSISVATNGTQYSVTQSVVGQVEGNGFTSTTQYSISNTNYSISNPHFSAFSGNRFWDVPLATLLAPGAYWLVVGYSTSTASNSARLPDGASFLASQFYGDTAVNSAFGVMGSTNLTSGNMFGGGMFSTAGGGTTAALPFSAISSSQSHWRPYFQMANSA